MAMTATQPNTLTLELKTDDDLFAMPEDGNRYELILGEIVMSPSPKTGHQQAIGRLYEILSENVRRHRYGELFLAPLDVRFSRFEVVQPDILFVRKERRSIITADRIEGAPDLVVEVLSPSNRSQDLVHKAYMYRQHGVSEYWIVDPEAKLITFNVFVDGEYIAVAPVKGRLSSKVLPGFSLQPDDVFQIDEWMEDDPPESDQE